MRRQKIFEAAAIGSVIFASAAFLIARQMPISPALFPVFYAAAPSKTAFLSDYSSKIWQRGGGYILPSVQQFLCAKLENPASGAETQTIADFYASQAFGREYGPLGKISDAAKICLIGALFRHLPGAPLHSRMRSLFLIEEVRRGEMIGKGYFTVVDFPRFSHYLRVHPVRRKRDKTEEVAQRVLLNWWEAKLPDSKRLRQNPLGNAGIQIYGY